jgi:purine nucleoside phosphorylase
MSGIDAIGMSTVPEIITARQSWHRKSSAYPVYQILLSENAQFETNHDEVVMKPVMLLTKDFPKLIEIILNNIQRDSSDA